MLKHTEGSTVQLALSTGAHPVLAMCLDQTFSMKKPLSLHPLPYVTQLTKLLCSFMKAEQDTALNMLGCA